MTGTDELLPEPEIASVPGPSRTLSRRSGLSDVLGMLIVLGGLAILFGLLSKHFWTGQTVKIIVNQIADLTVVSVGMTFVLVIGGIDLSVGSVLALWRGPCWGSLWWTGTGRSGWPSPAASRSRDLRRGERPGVGALVDSLVHRHAGHAGNGTRGGLPGHELGDQVHRTSRSSGLPGRLPDWESPRPS